MSTRPLISKKAAQTLIAKVDAARARYHEAVEQGNTLCEIAQASGQEEDWARLRAAHVQSDRAKELYDMALYGLYGALQYYAGREP